VMTSPVEFPIYGKFKRMELSKEELLDFWSTVMRRADFKARTGEKVLGVDIQNEGTYRITSSRASYVARAVILALGKSGTPRKLDIPGENLPKVMYRLIEADHYHDKNILVVGGGDSAVEAAIGLALKGNHVTISYRQFAFNRIKERNAKHLAELTRKETLRVALGSQVIEIRENSVILDHGTMASEIPNDYVWIFAGGTPPFEFLQRIGVAVGADTN